MAGGHSKDMKLEIFWCTELTLKAGEVKPKFIYRGKRNTNNLVTEVDPQTRQKILNPS
jgi:hypothetical protein